MFSVFRNDDKYDKHQRAFRKVHYIFVACCAVILLDLLLPLRLDHEFTEHSEPSKARESVYKTTTNNGVFYSTVTFPAATDLLIKRTTIMGEAIVVYTPHGDGTNELSIHTAYDAWFLYLAVFLLSLLTLWIDKDELVVFAFGINLLMMAINALFAVIY